MYNFNDLSTQGLLIPGYPIVTQAGFYVENLVSLDDHHDFNQYMRGILAGILELGGGKDDELTPCLLFALNQLFVVSEFF